MGSSAGFRIRGAAWFGFVVLLGCSSVRALTVEGDLTYTSDYVLRGISETGGRSAGQADVHLNTRDGTFAGVFASTLGRTWRTPYGNLGWDFGLDEYIGHRFDLSQAWSATLTATNYGYLHGNTHESNDYQEVSAAASYLDFCTVTLGYLPDAVHYERGYRLGRYAAWTGDVATQLPLYRRLSLTAGVGYYRSDGDGYAFGNTGLALDIASVHLDAGYYVAQKHAQQNFPYGRAGSRFAATLTWHF